MDSEHSIVKWVILMRSGTGVGPFDDATSALIFAEEAKLDIDGSHEAIRQLIAPQSMMD